MPKTNPADIQDSNNPRYRHRSENTETPQPHYDVVTNSTQSTQLSINVGEFGAFELGIPVTTDADSNTWDNWNPDPLEIHGTNKALLLQISEIKLTAVRYDTTSPPFKKAYLRLNETWKSNQWRCTGSDARQYKRRLQVLSLDDGPVLEFDYGDSMSCNLQKSQTWRWFFEPALYDLLVSASSAGLGGSLWRKC